MDPETQTPVTASLRLRPATRLDCAFLAWGFDEAADGLFTAVFGARSHAILANAMSQPRNSFSYQRVLVARKR
jgi:hypothetical protein